MQDVLLLKPACGTTIYTVNTCNIFDKRNRSHADSITVSTSAMGHVFATMLAQRGLIQDGLDVCKHSRLTLDS